MADTIQLDEKLAAQVREVIDLLHSEAEDANSHGKLSLDVLVNMLLEDVVLVKRRPGSNEGHNMAQVLRTHVYKL